MKIFNPNYPMIEFGKTVLRLEIDIAICDPSHKPKVLLLCFLEKLVFFAPGAGLFFFA